MIGNTRDMLNPQDLAEAKQVGLRRKLEDARTDINALPELPEGANNAVQQAGMEMKMEVTELLKELESLKRKVDAGAQFILSQTVFDAEPVEKVAELTKGFPIPLVLGILPLRSHKHASFLNDSVPGMTVPPGVLDRLYNAEGDVGLEGVRIAQEILNKSISIIGGAYLVPAFNRYDYVAEVISGLANVD